MISYRLKRRIYWGLAHRWSILRLRRGIIFMTMICVMFIVVMGVIRHPRIFKASTFVKVDQPSCDIVVEYR